MVKDEETAISRLPEEQRICVFMFHYENYNVAEIAKEIGCSENTVRGRCILFSKQHTIIYTQVREKREHRLYCQRYRIE